MKMLPLMMLLVAILSGALVAGMAGAASELDTGFALPDGWAKRIADGIERNRKSECVVTVVDGSGKAVPDARVELDQKTHDFLFGCAFPSWNVQKQHPNPGDWAQFERYFLRLFNYATTENMLKWPSLEPIEGKPRYVMQDAFVDWAEKNRIKVKGHNLVWGLADGGYPAWLAKYGPEEMAQKVRKHILEVVGRYKGRIFAWDVVNEPLHSPWFEKHMSPDYIVKALRWAHEADPKALLLINEFGNQRNGQAAKFVNLCRAAVKASAPLDAIGEQAHDPPSVPSPQQIYEMLDDLAKLGKDIHLTEMTMPSNGVPVKSEFVSGAWTPEFQGKYYRYYYTVAFSHPDVKAISLWAMWDGCSWLPGGGIIERNWTPKPAYRELDKLINHEWMTHADGKTDEHGRFSVRGFHGRYSVRVSKGAEVAFDGVHITSEGPAALTVHLE